MENFEIAHQRGTKYHCLVPSCTNEISAENIFKFPEDNDPRKMYVDAINKNWFILMTIINQNFPLIFPEITSNFQQSLEQNINK